MLFTTTEFLIGEVKVWDMVFAVRIQVPHSKGCLFVVIYFSIPGQDPNIKDNNKTKSNFHMKKYVKFTSLTPVVLVNVLAKSNTIMKTRTLPL